MARESKHSISCDFCGTTKQLNHARMIPLGWLEIRGLLPDPQDSNEACGACHMLVREALRANL